MTPEVLSLYNFYASPLGCSVATALARQVESLWSANTEPILGLGYCPPIFDQLSWNESKNLALMPARQGVMHWPKGDRSQAALIENDCIPLDDNSQKRLLLLHALEHSRDPDLLLREVWRVLAPEGRVIVVVPNRRRIWSSLESTPFGHGNPYSLRQLKRSLEEKMFHPNEDSTALFLPPSQSFGVPKMLGAADWVIRGWAKGSGGVLLVEAEKKVYGGITEPSSEKVATPAIQSNS